MCKTKAPKLPADRVDYPFRKMSADDLQMSDMCDAPACARRRVAASSVDLCSRLARALGIRRRRCRRRRRRRRVNPARPRRRLRAGLGATGA
jgi:hypothetical protein